MRTTWSVPTTSARFVSVWGQIGVNPIESATGRRIGPPAAREEAVEYAQANAAAADDRDCISAGDASASDGVKADGERLDEAEFLEAEVSSV